MGNNQTIKPTSLTKIPQNYPKEPLPGKIQLLWDANYHSLYHKLSPYTHYNTGLISAGFKTEPYYYTFIDETKKGLNALKKYDSRIFPIGSAPIDVIRVSKFLGSGNGLIFLGKQFLLQTGNAYNETRIYNPTSPIVAAGMGLALGSVRPQRNFDTSAGLGGIARTLLGNAIPDAIFGMPKISQPSGTVPDALSTPMIGIGGKGLLRAGTAERGVSHLQSAWVPYNSKGSTLGRTFGSIAKNLFKSLFQNFIPQVQSGVKSRSDEGAYGLMIGAGFKRFSYNNEKNYFGQVWIAGSKIMRKSGQVPSSYRIFVKYDNRGKRDFSQVLIYSEEGFEDYIRGVGKTGYQVVESTIEDRPGIRYGDNVGTEVPNSDEYTNSDMMLQYGFYADPNQQFPTKKTDPKSIKKINETMQSAMSDIANTLDGVYDINTPSDSRVFNGGYNTKHGYDRLFSANKKNSTPNFYPDGVMSGYRSSNRVVDDTLRNGSQTSLKLPTAGRFDSINTLQVIDKSELGNPMNRMAGWSNSEWKPYENDQIALYFFDVVNEKYVPFRAAIKGVAESSTVNWEELSFIGRSDKLYSYGGFTRTLTFNISIVISSLVELAPTWQRINYLTTLVKPSNYTTNTYNGAMNRFMVPPMVMLTLGDLYKDQPILIQTISTTIPDDATWETQHGDYKWEHLSSYIKSKDPSVLYGQLPREIDISLTMVLLEKERAVAGGANFGHAPRDERWKPNGSPTTRLHDSLVVSVITDTATSPLMLPDPPLTVNPAPPFQFLPVTEPTIQIPVPFEAGRTNNVAPPFQIQFP